MAGISARGRELHLREGGIRLLADGADGTLEVNQTAEYAEESDDQGNVRGISSGSIRQDSCTRVRIWRSFRCCVYLSWLDRAARLSLVLDRECDCWGRRGRWSIS